MAIEMAANSTRIFAAGAAHVDRRGRALVPFILGASHPGTMRRSIGGSVMNASMALRRFGADVALFSGRGGDADAAIVSQALSQAGIDDHALTWLDRSTPGYTAILDDHGSLVAGIADMALYDLLSPRVLSRVHLRGVMARSQALILDANLPEAAIGHLLTVFADRPSAAIGVSPAKVVRLSSSLSRLSMVFLSRAEAAALVEASSGTSMSTLARLLREAGAKRAVVTDGPNDAAILDQGAIHLQAPQPAEKIRDVTGAGDTLAALASLTVFRGGAFLDGVRLGMAAATQRVSGEVSEAIADNHLLHMFVADLPPPRRVESD